MSFVIHPAEPNDFPATEEIERAADALFSERFQAEDWPTIADAEERAAAPGFTLIAIEPAIDKPVGFAQVLEFEGIAHLEQLSVLPEFGRRGLGGRLVEAAAAEARVRGYADVPWNAPLYARHGFAETEPATTFHRRLIAVESELGLFAHGRRVQMTRPL